jgi:ubiquinone/menaquinone biosynthesis C-methylase UbiE
MASERDTYGGEPRETPWNAVWSEATRNKDIFAQLNTRLTQETFRAISNFVSPDDRAILDAGCGAGRFSVLLARQNPAAQVHGIDVSTPALAAARELAKASGCTNVEFSEGSIVQLPYPDDSFDLVFSEGVVCLFQDGADPSPSRAMTELIRVVRPGGRIMVAVPNWNCVPHTVYKWTLNVQGRQYEYGYEKSFTPRSLRRLFHDTGLRDVKWAGYFPAYGFFRLRGRLGLPRLERVLEVCGRIADRLARSRIERTFGFQIVAVGTKGRRAGAGD